MRLWLVLAVIWSAGKLGSAADPVVSYQRDVRPLLLEKCSTCHGVLEQQAGLRLDAGQLLHQGSEGGPVVEPGDASASLLIHRVSAADPDERMPPADEGEPLSDEQIAKLTAWINAGAVFPEDEPVPLANASQHWAYQLPARPAVPSATNSQWAHPIDAFIAREHRRLGLEPVEMADPHTLARRLYFGLLGLPPSRQQLQDVVRDASSAQAWDDLVARLLDNPHYGERWGRHWMDVWRYSDWDGFKQELRGSQRHIWRWRDWIVQSLNDDKGYDRMIVEMLAADELVPNDPARLAATGFLARNYHSSNRNIWLDAMVEHTAKAFLGMTLNCARCHDHKYDPIPQTEYYQFRAIFEPHGVRVEQLPGQPDLLKDGLPRAFDQDLTVPTYLFLQGNEKRPDRDRPMLPAVPAILGGRFDVEPVALPVEAFFPALRDFVAAEQRAAVRKELAEIESAILEASAAAGPAGSDSTVRSPDGGLLAQKRRVAEGRLRSLELRVAADRARIGKGETDEARRLAQAAAESERQLAVDEAQLTVYQKRAEAAAANQQLEPKEHQEGVAKSRRELSDAEQALEAARTALSDNTDDDYTPLGKQYPRSSSGRRLALARWIASPNNPLTARVAVNHIWMRHFGAPLVENVFDFGLRSPRPRHADLLDWLAVELMEHDWSLKHLHRLILTSRTWRLASSVGPSGQSPNVAVDRDNHYLWKMNVQRLDAEIIRDSVLAVSEQLDSTMGGADIDFREGESSGRRSIYLRTAYEKQMTMLVLFDAASPNECYRRSESIIPQQALALTNSSLALDKSRLLARRLWRDASHSGDSPQSSFVRTAFLQILSRPHSADELQACLQFLSDQPLVLADLAQLTPFAGGSDATTEPAQDPLQRALENLVHVLMNHNDFVTVR